jgi:hypothetical protein
MNKKHILLATLLLGLASPAFAYLGPGMGGGVIAAVLGVIGSFFLALFGILYYPIKRIMRKKKNADGDKKDA